MNHWQEKKEKEKDTLLKDYEGAIDCKKKKKKLSTGFYFLFLKNLKTSSTNVLRQQPISSYHNASMNLWIKTGFYLFCTVIIYILHLDYFAMIKVMLNRNTV